MIGRGFVSPPPILVVNGSVMSRTRIRAGMSWQNAFAYKFRGLPSQLLLSSKQQMRSHSTQGKVVKRKNNDENGHKHAATSGEDELHTHTHSHSILGHSHTHGGDEHEHGHDPEQILAALKGSGV